MSDRPRVILAIPDFRECTALSDWLLEDGLEPVRRPTAGAALEEMRARPFDLLIADADLAFNHGLRAGGRMRHPGIPTLVVGDADAGRRCQSAGQWAMFVERPVDRAMVSCTVSMAILDARPARQSARKPISGFNAFVNGVPSHILDISNEGVRLAVPGERRWAPPPYFSVRISMVGVAVMVQRMWALPPGTDRLAATTCGGALASNRPAAEQAWRAFVEAVPAGGGSTASLLAE